MGKLIRIGLVVVLIGAFLPFFFRVGWEERKLERTPSGKIHRRTGVIVLREAAEGDLTEEEARAIEAKYDDEHWGDAMWEIHRLSQQREVRSIAWPARFTDVLGLSVAFLGIVLVVIGLTSSEGSPLSRARHDESGEG